MFLGKNAISAVVWSGRGSQGGKPMAEAILVIREENGSLSEGRMDW